MWEAKESESRQISRAARVLVRLHLLLRRRGRRNGTALVIALFHGGKAAEAEVHILHIRRVEDDQGLAMRCDVG